MDANVRMDKSEVLQAMKTAGWRDVSSGLGDTFGTGFKEKRKDDTIMWTKSGEEQFGKTHAPANTAVQEDRIHSIGSGWATDDLLEAG